MNMSSKASCSFKCVEHRCVKEKSTSRLLELAKDLRFRCIKLSAQSFQPGL